MYSDIQRKNTTFQRQQEIRRQRDFSYVVGGSVWRGTNKVYKSLKDTM